MLWTYTKGLGICFWLAGGLAGWLAGWLDGWLAGWLAKPCFNLVAAPRMVVRVGEGWAQPSPAQPSSAQASPVQPGSA